MVAGWVHRIFTMYNPVLIVPLSTCSNIFRFSGLHIYSYTKKNYQGDDNRNRGPLDIYQVHHDIQNTNGFWRGDTKPYFSHENLDSFIVCILPRWNVLIHTVSRKLDIIDLTDGLSIQSLG